MPWRGPNEPGEFPTLGYDVGAWIESTLVIPDGYNKGKPYLLTDEMWKFLIHFYRLYPYAQPYPAPDALRYMGAQLRRSQKWGKDPFGAAILWAEALGPTKFDGWTAGGEPVGAPYPTPLIVCLGTSEEQVDNTWRPFVSMGQNGPINDTPGLDIGLTRTNLPGGGKVEPATCSARARLGAPMTMVSLTEALAVTTPIPTPSGWTTMGQLSEGDLVFGADGLPTEVISATEVQTDRLCYRVTFVDGSSLIASDGHLWLSQVNGRKAQFKPKVRTTEQMYRDGRSFCVPAMAPAKTPDIDLPIDPYVLGLWLGDGDARYPMLYIENQDVPQVRDEISARGFTVSQCLSSAEGKGCQRLYLSYPGAGSGKTNTSFKQQLRVYGLAGNKHIPDVYLRAGIEQRVELLRGLMDSDGCATTGGYCFFANTDRDLVHQVAELARSVGQSPSITWRADSRSRVGGCYKMGFTPRHDVNPFRLTRKADRVHQHRQGPWVSIRSIEPVPAEPVRCIAVNNADRLFVAGEGWNVTHNTHLFTTQGGFRKVAGAVKRNVAGMDGRWLELTNAWDPTELSEAQITASAKDDRILIDTVEPKRVEDLTNDEELYEELIRQYGDSARERGGWVNVRGRIMHDVRSDIHLEADRRRFFLNEIVVGQSAFIQPERWDSLSDNMALQPKDEITLGFDGSKRRDATALVAERRSDHRLFTLRVWERPKEAGDNWSLPTKEVDQAVRDAFDAYRVGAMFADPFRWQDYLDNWSGLFPGRIIEFATNQEQRMDRAIERFTTAVNDGMLLNDGSEELTRHVRNCVLTKGIKKKARPGEETDLSTHYMKMAKRGNDQWIDAAVAAVLAHEAMAYAIENKEFDKLIDNEPWVVTDYG